MAFGRQRPTPAPPVEPMPWEGIGWFVLSDVEQPAASRRDAVTGLRAIRVPSVDGPVRCFAPAVLVGRADPGIRAYELHAARDPSVPVCAFAPVTGGKGGEHYRVTDGAGQEIGTVHRTVAAKRTIQHAWWLRQPGHPDIVARYHWAKGSAKEVTVRGKEAVARQAEKLADSVLGSMPFGGGDESGGSNYDIRKPVTWRAGAEEVALTADHTGPWANAYVLKAGWLDLRPAFALAVLRDA
ncbi:hypothetical protein [Streptomyces sp. NBC_00859]|uniref:hypothetical protein n=1 Tax=Streptomyces sp. NBC_00859 TaxID=2903682 RepID=UPI00386633CF|nr:hypothetical protein OG584_13905 [Streptomyces sp. NBC_00859]